MKLATSIGLALLMFITMNIARAGTFTNGSDLTSDKENAWFLGDEPVEYCVVTTPGFAIPLPEVKQIIRSAFDEWVGFFRKYGLDQLKFDGIADGRSLGVSLEFREVSSCTRPNEQIQFFIGRRSEQIQDALRFHQHALGLSLHGDYNHQTFRTGGQIWIANWGLWTPAKFKHIVLHEIGHTLGFEHDSVYVMETLAANLATLGRRIDSRLGRVESATWPYRLRTGDTIEFTQDGRKEGVYEPNFLLVFIRDFLGFAKEGHHSVKLTATETDLRLPTWDLKVAFTERETKKTVELKGSFFIRGEHVQAPRGLRGPRLFTFWHCDACVNKQIPQLHYLDPQPSMIDAEGSFSDAEGKFVFPAILDDRKGAFLRIFIPTKKQWWTVDNYNAVLGGRERQ